MPFLHKIFTLPTNFPDEFPFTLPVFAGGVNLDFRTNVTFFVGENGSGKSTLLEAIAGKCEFNLSGGNRNNRYNYRETESELVRFLKLSWSPKVTTGFFMRAESFFNFASYIDEMAEEFGPDIFRAYGGRSLHQQSHGEAFFCCLHTASNKVFICSMSRKLRYHPKSNWLFYPLFTNSKLRAKRN